MISGPWSLAWCEEGLSCEIWQFAELRLETLAAATDHPAAKKQPPAAKEGVRTLLLEAIVSLCTSPYMVTMHLGLLAWTFLLGRFLSILNTKSVQV